MMLTPAVADSSEGLRLFDGNGDALAPGGWNPEPDEQTYCICNQVSYGEMVACDNEDVSCCSLSLPTVLTTVVRCSVRWNGSTMLVSLSALLQKANGTVRSASTRKSGVHPIGIELLLLQSERLGFAI